MERQGQHKQKHNYILIVGGRSGKSRGAQRAAASLQPHSAPPHTTRPSWSVYLLLTPPDILCLCAFPCAQPFVGGGSSQKHITAGCKHSASWRSDVRRNTRRVTARGGWPTFSSVGCGSGTGQTRVETDGERKCERQREENSFIQLSLDAAQCLFVCLFVFPPT